MTSHPHLGRLFGLLTLGLLLVPVPRADAQTSPLDELFNDTSLHDIHLLVNTRDLALLRERYTLNTYYPADLVWKGQRVRNVGIRSRGTGSRNQNKLGLLVDFDRYTRNQQFLGLGILILDNVAQDASLVREFLAMKVYRRLGQTAPRIVFSRVFINNQYQGLYAAVEGVDSGFAARAFGASDGYLYEYHHIAPYFFGELPDDLPLYRAMFEPQTHLLESETQLFGPIRDLVRELNGPDDVVWRERVDERLDLSQFMAHVAVQGCLAQNDGILGFAGINNFYLYRPNASGRHRLIPWDEDYAFEFLSAPVVRRSDEGLVVPFERAWLHPDLRTVFLDTADACARTIGDDDWLLNEIGRLEALIGGAVADDTRKPFTTEAFREALEFLREFARTRPQLVLLEVMATR